MIKLDKSTSYVETVFQMLSAYVYQNVLPKNNYIRILLTPVVIAPINITGLLFGYILPKNHNFYHNNIVVAQKAQQKLRLE